MPKQVLNSEKLVDATARVFLSKNLKNIDLKNAKSPRQITSIWGSICLAYQNTFCFVTSQAIKNRWCRNTQGYQSRVFEVLKCPSQKSNESDDQYSLIDELESNSCF
jgi:hypothetical protein